MVFEKLEMLTVAALGMIFRPDRFTLPIPSLHSGPKSASNYAQFETRVNPCSPQYHMMTMRNTRYSTSQRFIERFDLDIVTLKAKANLPPWYRNHLDMLVRAVFLLSSCAAHFPRTCACDLFFLLESNRCFIL